MLRVETFFNKGKPLGERCQETKLTIIGTRFVCIAQQFLIYCQADLRRADFVVRRRAMEDAFMALKVEDILKSDPTRSNMII